jgi:ParB family chromosome partitioning protein
MAQSHVEPRLRFKYIAIKRLEVWHDVNVRKKEVYTDIEELANNIKEIGIQVPLLVTPKSGNEADGFWVISGQRRLIAAGRAGLDEVPCVIDPNIKPLDARIASFSENIYRLAMTDDDKSSAAATLLQKLKSKDAVARKLGVTIETVNKYLGYTYVPEPIKDLVRQHKMTSETAIRIHRKFQDTNTAIEIAKAYADTAPKQKHVVYEAIKEAAPSMSAGEVKQMAKKKSGLIPYKVFLPPSTSNTVKDLAKGHSLKPEDVISQIVEQWIDEFKKGLVEL